MIIFDNYFTPNFKGNILRVYGNILRVYGNKMKKLKAAAHKCLTEFPSCLDCSKILWKTALPDLVKLEFYSLQFYRN